MGALRPPNSNNFFDSPVRLGLASGPRDEGSGNLLAPSKAPQRTVRALLPVYEYPPIRPISRDLPPTCLIWKPGDRSGTGHVRDRSHTAAVAADGWGPFLAGL